MIQGGTATDSRLGHDFFFPNLFIDSFYSLTIK